MATKKEKRTRISLVTYFKGVNKEAHRIRWPMKNFLLKNVLIVISVTIVCSVVLFLLDFLTAEMMRQLNNAFQQNSTATSSGTSSVASTIINYIRLFFTSIF